MVAYKDKEGNITVCFNDNYSIDENNHLWWHRGEAWEYYVDDIPQCLINAMGDKSDIGFYLADDENGEVAIGNDGNNSLGYCISFRDNIITKYPPLFIGEFNCWYEHIKEEIMCSKWGWTYKKVCTLPKKGEIRHYRIEKYNEE